MIPWVSSRPALPLATISIASLIIPWVLSRSDQRLWLQDCCWVSNIGRVYDSLSIDHVPDDSLIASPMFCWVSNIDPISNLSSIKWIRSALPLAHIARFVEYRSQLQQFVEYQSQLQRFVEYRSQLRQFEYRLQLRWFVGYWSQLWRFVEYRSQLQRFVECPVTITSLTIPWIYRVDLTNACSTCKTVVEYQKSFTSPTVEYQILITSQPFTRLSIASPSVEYQIMIASLIPWVSYNNRVFN